MRLIRFDSGRLGVLTGDDEFVDVTDLSPVNPGIRPQVNDLAFFEALPELRAALHRAQRDRPRRRLSDAALQSPVGRPANLIAFPANYHAHREEMSSPNRADRNGFFLKATTSLCGPRDAIVLPELAGREIHHECELAVIVGREARMLDRDAALGAVLGYSCLIDVTVRGSEERVMRKSYDTFTPLGPWLVTADEISDPDNLDMKLTVNGDHRQQANTRDLIVDVRGMLVLASAVMTLYPGDVIATGTPAGVGPLKPGDDVTIAIDRVGVMTLPVTAGRGGSNQAFEYGTGPA